MGSSSESMTHAQRAAIGATAGDQARAGQSVTLAAETSADGRPRIESTDQMLLLLAWAAGYDGRVRGPRESEAWLAALGPHEVALEDARAAITAYFNGPNRHRWITPGDVLELLEEGDL